MSVAIASRRALVDAMLDPDFYPHRPRTVELRETNISWVFRAGTLAYKVKKPIVLPFLDYGTLERRRRMCEAEVRLNRPLASSVYLRVVGIFEREGRFAIGSVGGPGAIEYAVEMRAVEEERSIEALARGGELEQSQITAVARRLARFHAEVPVAGRDPRRLDHFIAAITDNLATMSRAGEGILSEDRLRAAGGFTASSLAARWTELERRLLAGRLRECHGDLRAEHVILPPAAPPYVYDCVEFSARLREIDVSADLAFLVMDLLRLGEKELAKALVRDYRSAGGDPGDDRLIDFFAAYRAWVRATVACERARELPLGEAERRRQERAAEEYLAIGHRLAWDARGPLLLVVCGVAASGKTTLAERLAEISGWPHLCSDLIRKRLAGVAPTARGARRIYDAGSTARTYRELGREARSALADERGVIVDATFHRRAERDSFAEGLGGLAAPQLTVQCVASRSTLLRRAASRQREAARVSDAGPEIVHRQLAEWEPFDRGQREGNSLLELCTELDPAGLVALVERDLDRWL
ncbi:MAG: AAA family ATPase [Solirubrobacterales bacterium]